MEWEDIPQSIRKDMKFVFASQMDEILDSFLTRKLKKKKTA